LSERNWAGNLVYGARRLHRPATRDELRAIVAAAPRVRVLGSRHCFNAIADSDELVSLADLPAAIEVDRAGGTVTCGGAVTYGQLAPVLERAGMALGNLASLPHISVAGAVATATHGSGDASGNLATAVASVELVTSEGDVLTLDRGDADFDGVVVGLGALGAVTRLTLDAEPAYAVRQDVYEQLDRAALAEHFDAITASGDSVSVFTRWGETADQVWVKRRVTDDRSDAPHDVFGARPADGERHPIPGHDPVNCTAQGGRPGPWYDRLPHFRLGFTPSSGDELQSELLLPREHVAPALDALHGLAPAIRPLLQISEIRTVAADTLWLSPQYGRATVGFHFTWKPEPAAVLAVLADIEAALAPLGARPHWGKLFTATGADLAPRYERLADFAALAERLDPRGAFRNDWLERHVLGAAAPGAA
jgi:xylitol oxidase